MQGLLKKTIAITKANSSKFHSHRFSTLSSFGTFAAATDNVAPPPQLPPFDYEPQPYKGPLADEVFAKRKKFLGPSLFHYCQKLLNIVEGKMQYLFDESGRRYLDAFARIVTVSCGHCHPEVLNAILEQSKLLRHATTIYLHHAIADFAEALASKMAVNLKVVSFVNSGSEANELAMLMARLYTGNLGMISLRNAYHGGSSSTIGLTALNTWKYPIPEGEIHGVVNPDPHHGMTHKKLLKLWGEIKQKKVVVLIDCGATNNIITNRVVEELKLPITETPEYSVELIDGHEVKSKGICKGILLQLQGVQIEQDFFLVDLVVADVLLGLDWLEGLGEIRANFKDLTFKIDKEGQTVTFKGEPSLD